MRKSTEAYHEVNPFSLVESVEWVKVASVYAATYLLDPACTWLLSLRFILHRVTTRSLLPHYTKCELISQHVTNKAATLDCALIGYTVRQTLNAQVMIKTESIKCIIITAINQDTYTQYYMKIMLLIANKNENNKTTCHQFCTKHFNYYNFSFFYRQVQHLII